MPRKKKEDEVITQEVAQEAQEDKAILCGLSVMMSEAGDISVHVHGSNQNLVLMDGLLKYAERYLDNTWKERIK